MVGKSFSNRFYRTINVFYKIFIRIINFLRFVWIFQVSNLFLFISIGRCGFVEFLVILIHIKIYVSNVFFLFYCYMDVFVKFSQFYLRFFRNGQSNSLHPFSMCLKLFQMFSSFQKINFISTEWNQCIQVTLDFLPISSVLNCFKRLYSCKIFSNFNSNFAEWW